MAFNKQGRVAEGHAMIEVRVFDRIYMSPLLTVVLACVKALYARCAGHLYSLE